MKIHLNEKGVLHLPLALLAVVLVLTGLALWGLLHRWKSLTQTQLRLDHCTGGAALELKSKLLKISSINAQMERFRDLEAAATLEPSAQEALFVAVNAEAARQDAIRMEWTLKRARWLTSAMSGSTCGARGDTALPLPVLDWARGVPDELGAVPLRLEELPASFHFEVRHSPRASAAEVYRRGDPDGNLYYAHWVEPRQMFRPSIY